MPCPALELRKQTVSLSLSVPFLWLLHTTQMKKEEQKGERQGRKEGRKEEREGGKEAEREREREREKKATSKQGLQLLRTEQEERKRKEQLGSRSRGKKMDE